MRWIEPTWSTSCAPGLQANEARTLVRSANEAEALVLLLLHAADTLHRAIFATTTHEGPGEWVNSVVLPVGSINFS